MKKAFLLLASALLAVSCTDSTFDYSLKVDGDVQSSAVVSNFSADVANVPNNTFLLASDAPYMTEGSDADKFITEEALRIVEATAGEGAIYEINIVGFVKESTTGLELKVDKKITNKE